MFAKFRLLFTNSRTPDIGKAVCLIFWQTLTLGAVGWDAFLLGFVWRLECFFFAVALCGDVCYTFVYTKNSESTNGWNLRAVCDG